MSVQPTDSPQGSVASLCHHAPVQCVAVCDEGEQEVLQKRKQVLLSAILRAERWRGGAVEQAVECIVEGDSLSSSGALVLWREAPNHLLSLLSQYVRVQWHGMRAYYNRNAHIEPTNICRFHCEFCSFRREREEEGAWYYTLPQIEAMARECVQAGVTEIHITGGVPAHWTLSHIEEIIATVRNVDAHVHIKAFSAVELVAILKECGVCYAEGLQRLHRAGLNSIPGGGAEIFAPRVRALLCPHKATGAEWLALHEAAHKANLRSNATMLFGHVETLEERVDHLMQLRTLQARTGGFHAFIPLKYRAAHNRMSTLGETSTMDVLRTYAMSRLVLDNIAHIKAYWPMLGKRNACLALHYGVDDLDGTVRNTTKIYSMAGAEEQAPSWSEEELRAGIQAAGYMPYERDSAYRRVERDKES